MARIGIDIDEVLCETERGFLAFYNSRYGTDYKHEQMIEYSFGRSFGVSEDEEKSLLDAFFASDNFINAGTIPGSKEAVVKLSQDNEMYAISSRPTALMQTTMTWIGVHFPNCFKEVILTDSHYDDSVTKSDICEDKGLKFLVEDQIRYAEGCAEVCPTVYLMDKPWNQAKLKKKNIIRVKSWEEIMAHEKH